MRQSISHVASILILVLLAGAGQAQERGKGWDIHGQVVDERGVPVEEFEAASFWSSNGKQWDEAGNRIRTTSMAEASKVCKEEGVLAAYPSLVATRLAEGRFHLDVSDRPRVSVFAVDKNHERGGYVSVEKNLADKPVTITLRPLVRVHGTIYCPEAERTPDWTMAIVHPVDDFSNYLHFTQCGSVQGKFSFLLPPGIYDLDVYSSSPSARIQSSGEPQKPTAPAEAPQNQSGIRSLADGIRRVVKAGI